MRRLRFSKAQAAVIARRGTRVLPVFLARSRCGNLSRASDSHLRVTGTTWSLLDVHKESGDPLSARVQEGKLFMQHEKKKSRPTPPSARDFGRFFRDEIPRGRKGLVPSIQK